ncbi:MAG: histidine--tRNA ligase [Proteobacteria bacterium]|nr:histidine--tRNA ligase [Pseudomonadota bacterium]
MAQLIQSIRGMNDLLPEVLTYWHALESVIQKIMMNYGYEEIRLPIMESTELFSRTIGEVTDVVEKEMYTFLDRNGDSLSLRPEATAGCVRACLEHGLLHNATQRLWYSGPMFRYERPQKGRYRQFYQIGAEALGFETPDIDAEIIMMTAQFWEALGLTDQIELQLNSLGSVAVRRNYREQLVQYFKSHQSALDEDSKRRLGLNPLRILDSKNPEMQGLIANAPSILDYLDEASSKHFNTLRQYLDAAGLNYKINPRLVRGLDYYTDTAFEWVTEQLGAQGTVCGGGRYNGLVEQLGGQATPAIGFAMGLERIVELYKAKQASVQSKADVYLITDGERARYEGFLLSQKLRKALPDLQLIMHCGSGGFKSQFKKADKCGARFALILGEDEIAQHKVSVKFLREEKEQLSVTFEELVNVLK